MAKLTLGPLLFNWPPERWRDFYLAIADEAPVDSVCLGEVVCLKRRPLVAPYLAEVENRLRAAGKEIVVSTPALIMNEREMAEVRAIVGEEGRLVEANDVAVAALLAGRPHAVGPFVNVYNEGTLGYLVERGAGRVCLPVELPAGALAILAAATEAELEVQVFGRLPLAISARCYHARAHGLAKDDCRFACGEDPDGMEIQTLDGAPFLAVNGTQVLSSTYGNLVRELPALQETGIARFRLSPHDVDMVAVARLFRDVLDGRREPEAGFAGLGALIPGAAFSSGFYHGIEGAALCAGAGVEAQCAS